MKRKTKGFFQWSFISLLTIAVLYVSLLLFPNPLFANKITYRRVTVFSDRPIHSNITHIIDDALSNLSRSELYDSNLHFNIYLCNQLWRFQLFTMGNANAGAVTLSRFTRDIFFRPCDIANNKIIPSSTWFFAKNAEAFKDKPLSYYFAHEMTHKLQSVYLGRLNFSIPKWITEGYADYIGKGEHFDFAENLRLWHGGAPELDPKKGLYRLYHLKIAYLMNYRNQTIKEIYQKIPDDDSLTAVLWKLNY